MGLSTSLNTAVAGLNATQVGIGVVSQNVANAGTAGYVRRTVTTSEVSANGTLSTSSNQVQRLLDQIVQRQLWQESAGAAYTSARADALSSLDQMFGTPGKSDAFDAAYSAFTSSLQALQNDPSSYTNRTAVLDTAQVLATRFNSLSDNIQTLRSQAEAGLANAAGEVNKLLQNLSAVNAKVVQGGDGPSAAGLKDERDRILSDLSQYFDLRTTENERGSIAVFTNSGVQIFDGVPAVTFGFTQYPDLGPTSEWTPVAATRTVGTITLQDGSGNKTDAIANKTFRSGEIAAFVELRDNTLVKAQTQLDEIAAHLSSALSDREIAGTAATSGTATGYEIDLSGLQSGNTVTLDYRVTPSATTQRFTFVKVNGSAALPASASSDPASGTVVGIDFSGGLSSVVSQIQSAIGSGFTVSGTAPQTLTIVDDGTALNTRDVVGLKAKATVTSVTGSPELPLFVDGGRGNAVYSESYDGGSQFVGFSARIALNPDLITDRSKLVVFSGTTAQGDSTRPKQMLERLNNGLRTFSRGIGVDGSTVPSSTTVSNYVQRVVASQGQSAEVAKRLDEGQKVALAAVQDRFAETSKVSVDQEMSLLIELQTAYAANARIISTVKEMMDTLLRM